MGGLWRLETCAHEPILLTKPYIGTTIADNVLKHGVGAYNQVYLQYVDEPENIMAGTDKNESGLHPTQKSVKLMQALIELVTIGRASCA